MAILKSSHRVVMRDGARLATTVYLPSPGCSSSTVLARTASCRERVDPGALIAGGFAVVVQDVRGRYDSEGSFYPFVNESQDGIDTLAWTSGQPGCNGRVGVFGDSYVAAT